MQGNQFGTYSLLSGMWRENESGGITVYGDYCNSCGHVEVCGEKANYVTNCPHHIKPVNHGRWIGVPITEGRGSCPYFNGDVGNRTWECVGAPFSCPCKRSSIWGKSTYHCSECGLEVGYSDVSRTNYCHNCGTKMDLPEPYNPNIPRDQWEDRARFE